jgi:hypothetical protein
MSKRQLSFDVVKMNVGLGPLRFSIPFKSDAKPVAEMADRWPCLLACPRCLRCLPACAADWLGGGRDAGVATMFLAVLCNGAVRANASR